MAELESRRRATPFRLRPAILAGCAVLLALLAYLPSVDSDFFSDDHAYVVGNAQLRGLPLSQLWRLWVAPSNPYEFLPLRDLSYRVDLALFGLDPLGYHLHNLLLYALCGLAVWLCCDALLGLLGEAGSSPITSSRRGWACAAATSVFAAHPAHAESVAWISGRKELLSGLFVLLCLWQFARAIGRPTMSRLRLAGASALFLAALMSKTAAVPAVGVAWLLAAVRLRSQGRTPLAAAARSLLLVAPMVVIAVTWLAIALAVGRDSGVRFDPFHAEAAQRTALAVALKIEGFLTRIAVMPVRLRMIYDVLQPGPTGALAQFLGALAFAAGAIGAWTAWSRRSLTGFAAATFVLFCLPFLQLVPFFTWSLASERFLFLPLFGLSLVAAGTLDRFGSARVGPVLCVLVVAGLGLTASQSWQWRSKDRLIATTARLSPESSEAQMLLITEVLLPSGAFDEAEGAASGVRDPLYRDTLQRYVRSQRALDRGDEEQALAQGRGLEFFVDSRSGQFLLMLVGRLAEAAGDDVEAARRYYQAEQRSRTDADREHARAALGAIRERYAERLALLRASAAERPDDIARQGTLANLEMELFLLDDAVGRYLEILRVRPDLAPAHYNLGLTYLRQERYREAVTELRSAIAGGLGSATAWNNLGIALKSGGEIDAAAEAFREALRLDAHQCHAAINLGRLHLALHEQEPARQAFRVARDQACGAEFQRVIELYEAKTAAPGRL